MSDNKENQPSADVRSTPKEKDSKAKTSVTGAEPKKTSQQASSETQNIPSRSGKLLAILALLIAVASIAGSYILWRQLNDARQELAGNDEQTKSSINAIRPEVSTLQTKLDSLETQMDTQLDRGLKEVNTKQQLLQESLQSLQVELGKEQSDDWVLAEAEYLMRIANNRLLLERDISTAIAALSIADTRLRDIGNPALIDVRRQLSDEITRLEAIEDPDITGMGLTLRSLQERVGLLPVKGESTTELHQTPANGETQAVADTGETSGWKRFLNQVWTALKSLVTIRRVNQDDSPLMPPEQRGFLKQNLRLQLETARLALFRNDDVSYHSSLETASDWLTKYFNTEAGSTASMLDAVERLNEAKLDQPLPDISGSLNSLRQLLAEKSVHVIKQQRPAAKPAPAAAPSPAAADQPADTAGVTSDAAPSGGEGAGNTGQDTAGDNTP